MLLTLEPACCLTSKTLSFRKWARRGRLRRQVAGVGALAEPARRALYQYVVGAARAGEPGAGGRGRWDLPLHSAKFHLDRLVEEGLLEVEFRRLTGRTGPGAGRPGEALPPRRPGRSRSRCRSAATTWSARSSPRRSTARRATAGPLDAALAGDAAASEGLAVGGRHGRGPSCRGPSPRCWPTRATSRGSRTRPVLANCPFDPLAADHTELVCGLNLAFVQGVADGLSAETTSRRAWSPRRATAASASVAADALSTRGDLQPRGETRAADHPPGVTTDLRGVPTVGRKSPDRARAAEAVGHARRSVAQGHFASREHGRPDPRRARRLGSRPAALATRGRHERRGVQPSRRCRRHGMASHLVEGR